MTTRIRAGAAAVVCVLAVALAVGYVVRARHTQQRAAHDAPSVAQISLAAAESGPHIVFRSTALGPTYGRVAVVPLSDPGGPRAVTGTNCNRVYAVQRSMICLSQTNPALSADSARVITGASSVPLPLAGTPSRARLSADTRLAATTTFVSGDSYTDVSLSTRTTITNLGTGTHADLESYALMHDGHRIAPVDRNFWGVTFAGDDDTFYATAEWSRHTWLVRGSISRRTVTTLHEDAECPSLSPDGRHLVFKQQHGSLHGTWHLVEYDVATGAISALAETRSIDDQVAWLDDDHIMYGLNRDTAQSAVADVWQVPADGSGHPSVLVPQASSPSLVR